MDFKKEEFSKANINSEFLDGQIKQYFLYKKAKMADKIINEKQTLKDRKPRNIRNMLINHKKFEKIFYNKFDNTDMKNHLNLIIYRIDILHK